MTDRIPLDRDPRALSLWANNSKTHSPEQIEQIARSIQEFGFTKPVIIDEADTVLAGHGARLAAIQLGLTSIPCVRIIGLNARQKRAYVIADNKIAENAPWDLDNLRVELRDLGGDDFDLSLVGFSDKELDGLLRPVDLMPGEEPPTPPASTTSPPVTESGDIWILGGHRLMCGDSTDPDAVGALMQGARASLLHADPPYGMGKERDGVANDNLRGDKLDAFQLHWWAACRRHIEDNSGVYIWGTAPDLWRLWYVGGLADSEPLTLRNEIVWGKGGGGNGMLTGVFSSYPTTTERCLFFVLGVQGYSVKEDDYWGGWDEIRLYLRSEADSCGLTRARMAEVCGVDMYAHWLNRSDWRFIPGKHYTALATAYPGRFTKPYDQLKKSYGRLKKDFYATRAYFDNTHDAMSDLWTYPRVVGDERHGHATPKPVAMMERVMCSSLPRGGLCLEPFAGTGSTLMAAERTGRRCYTMELNPAYVDVIVRRWQEYTGRDAVHENGATFAQLEGGT